MIAVDLTTNTLSRGGRLVQVPRMAADIVAALVGHPAGVGPATMIELVYGADGGPLDAMRGIRNQMVHARRALKSLGADVLYLPKPGVHNGRYQLVLGDAK